MKKLLILLVIPLIICGCASNGLKLEVEKCHRFEDQVSHFITRMEVGDLQYEEAIFLIRGAQDLKEITK